MAVSWDFVDALSAQIGQCTIVPGERREWCVKGKAVAWERPLSKKDLAALGADAPAGRVMAVHVEDLGVKQAWIETVPRVCFSSPHFSNYPAVLIDMELADEQLVREIFSESAAWLEATR